MMTGNRPGSLPVATTMVCPTLRLTSSTWSPVSSTVGNSATANAGPSQVTSSGRASTASSSASGATNADT